MAVVLLAAYFTQAEAQNNPKKKAAKAGPMAPVTDVEGLPRVLLIGDSISIGYTLPVRKALEGKVNVHRPRTNCGPTTKGLQGIDEWLATGGSDKKWDLIHFNWGLHDLKYMGPNGENLADPKAADSKQQVPPDEYRKNLQQLVDRLQETGATLIWRNTTPVPEGSKGRATGHSQQYNEIAREIMEKEKIQIQDLYSFTMKDQENLQKKADVHYTGAGSQALGEEVATLILDVLEK